MTEDIDDRLLQIDWVRTAWQFMHYVASAGMAEPLEEWLTLIDARYEDVWDRTVRIFFDYLSDRPNQQDLCVDSDWLITWLASNVLLSKRLAEYYHLPARQTKTEAVFSPSAKMRYVMYLSQHVLYALHCARQSLRKNDFVRDRDSARYATQLQRPPFADVPIGLVPSLSEAQLYILSEYAYHEIGVHRELRIFERLTRQLYYELPLYAAGDFYRDHLYHVVDVCLLGELLLRSLQPSDGSDHTETLADSAARSADITASEQLLQNWYVAALCHDLGYIVEQVGNVLKPAGEINGAGLDDLIRKTKQGLDEGKNSLRQVVDHAARAPLPDGPKWPADEVGKAEPTDHGVVGWLHLSDWLGQVDSSFASLAHALQAILRHNLPDQIVSICEEPLSLLLILCDHLQEWGRPRVGGEPLARAVMEAMRFSEQAEFEQKIRVRQLFVRGLEPASARPADTSQQPCIGCQGATQCTNGCLRVYTQIGHDGLQFRLSHAESREADFEPGISWFLLCRDLQCLGSQPDAWPYPVTIVLEHAPARIWRDLPWRPLEMDLLQDFASSYRPASYLCEWIEAARRGDKGVKYTGDRDTGQETFTIELKKLHCPLRRGLTDNHWKEFRKWKWQRLGQQFIALSLGTWFPES